MCRWLCCRRGITHMSRPSRHTFDRTSPKHCRPLGTSRSRKPAKRVPCGRYGSSTTCTSNRCTRSTTTWLSIPATASPVSVSTDEKLDCTTSPKDRKTTVSCWLNGRTSSSCFPGTQSDCAGMDLAWAIDSRPFTYVLSLTVSVMVKAKIPRPRPGPPLPRKNKICRNLEDQGQTSRITSPPQ